MTDRLIRRKDWHFTIIENSIIDCEDLDIYEKMTYITLCRYAGNKESCFPSYDALAKKVGCSRRKVIYVVKELIDKGLITKQSCSNNRNGDVSNIYIVNDPDEFFNKPTSGEQQAYGGVNDVHWGSERRALGGVNDVHRGSERRAPEEESFNNNHLEEESVSQSIIDNTILYSMEGNNGNNDGQTDGRTDTPEDIITGLMAKYGLSEGDMEICLAKLEGRDIRNPIGFLEAVVRNYLQEKKIIDSSRASPSDGRFKTTKDKFVPPKNYFNSYNQRKYDVKELEKRLLERSMHGEEDDS